MKRWHWWLIIQGDYGEIYDFPLEMLQVRGQDKNVMQANAFHRLCETPSSPTHPLM
jgi:hypothetical protein